jgi:hypothetical protein
MESTAANTAGNGAQKIGQPAKGAMRQPGETAVSDRDRLNGILRHEKQLMQSYTAGLAEALDRDLYKLFRENRSRIEALHSRIAEALFHNGGSASNLASQTQVTEACELFRGYLNQLPYTQ